MVGRLVGRYRCHSSNKMVAIEDVLMDVLNGVFTSMFEDDV